MTFSNNNIKSLVETLIPFIQRIARTQTNSCLKVQKALVVSKNDDGFYTVRIPGSVDSSNDFEVVNKYSLDVKVGKYVDLYYSGELINAYIGNIHNGTALSGSVVNSINGKTGNVTLQSSDVGAIQDPQEKMSGQLLRYDGSEWAPTSTMVQIWENEDASQAFDAKTININNLDKYKILCIRFCVSTSLTGMCDDHFVKCYNNICFTMHHPTNSYVYKRRFQTYSDRIEFQNGYRDTTAGSTYCIPLAVYGVL